MMLDADVVAVSPSSVWRVLRNAGRLQPWNGKASKKGTGFVQPLKPHEHWHIDVSYLNVSGTFYYLCSVLDGFSAAIAHWEIRESMTEAEVEIILLRAGKSTPKPRPVSSATTGHNSRQGLQGVHPDQRNDPREDLPLLPPVQRKIERWHKSLKNECIRPKTPLNLEDAQRVVGDYVSEYNTVRLHSAIGYVTPQDMLDGRQAEIHAARDRKLEAAREERRKRRQLNQQTAVV